MTLSELLSIGFLAIGGGMLFTFAGLISIPRISTLMWVGLSMIFGGMLIVGILSKMFYTEI
jgi:hypothetical protein